MEIAEEYDVGLKGKWLAVCKLSFTLPLGESAYQGRRGNAHDAKPQLSRRRGFDCREKQGRVNVVAQSDSMSGRTLPSFRFDPPGGRVKIAGVRLTGCSLLLVIVAFVGWSTDAVAHDYPPITALPEASSKLDPAHVALGRKLFFDPRLSGDATISCATCHNPAHGWADGLPMSDGYPGSKYFRNTPTVINASLGRLMYWDGRLPAADMPTIVRDHIAEAHFFQADGRLIIERMRQVPEYEDGFKSAFGGEPTYGRILNSVSAFVKSLRSQNVPFDQFVGGDKSAISESAVRGIELFQDKAGCIQCHNGAMLSDGQFHSLGLEVNKDIFRDPQRHITFRRFFRTLGVPGYENLRSDPGLLCVSKAKADMGLMRTPTLREVSNTAPYMHDGQLATLEEVVSFYNAGGGPDASRDAKLKPLGLTDNEQTDLVEFLKTLSGDPLNGTKPELPKYELRKPGENN